MTGALIVGALVGWQAASTPKAQGVRLLDVWVLGPLMVYAATQGADTAIKTALAAVGAGTITYNGRNYLRAR